MKYDQFLVVDKNNLLNELMGSDGYFVQVTLKVILTVWFSPTW